MTTTQPRTTKQDLIDILAPAGKGTRRALRGHTLATLTEMVTALNAEKADTLLVRIEDADEADEAAEVAATYKIDPKMVYTTAEVAQIVGLTKFAVRRWVSLGQLPTYQNPNAPVVKAHGIAGDDLNRFLAARVEERAAKRAAKAAKAAKV